LDALERLKNVFIYAQTFWALWKNPEAQKMWGTLKVLYGQIVKAENSFCCCPLFWVLSHMKESMLARTTLEALVNMKGF
jgi:hypothetical protein